MIIMWGKKLCRQPSMSKMKKNRIKSYLLRTCCCFCIPAERLLHHFFIHLFYFNPIRTDQCRWSLCIIHSSGILTCMKYFNGGLCPTSVNLKYFFPCLFSFVFSKRVWLFRTCETGSSRFHDCMSCNHKCRPTHCLFFEIITCRCCYDPVLQNHSIHRNRFK